MKKITREELSHRGGGEGPPVYIALNGKVYDVTESPLWEDGDHQGEHTAGMDLSQEITDAPHETDVLDSYPVVGELEEG